MSTTQLLDPTARQRAAPRLQPRDFRHLLLFLGGFAVLCLAFNAVRNAFPFVKDGAQIVADAKLLDERSNRIFPHSGGAVKVIVFGNSIMLAGFQAKRFDELGRYDGLELASYNAGLPARTDFVPELRSIVASGNPPDVILMTEPWQADRPHSLFSLPVSDHDMADRIFPFHGAVRDFVDFAVRSRQQGGLRAFYRLSADNEAQMRRDQGYFFIREQSRYPGDRLPDTAHSPSDKPDVVIKRSAVWSSHELDELNELLRRHPMACLFVPSPGRRSAEAPAPYDQEFARQLAAHTPCQVVGPYYFTYPNSYFSDYMHLNPAGARIYTEALYHLIKPYLKKGNSALQ
jgi:hypothetical protein